MVDPPAVVTANTAPVPAVPAGIKGKQIAKLVLTLRQYIHIWV